MKRDGHDQEAPGCPMRQDNLSWPATSRPRLSPTDHGHAVTAREYQTDSSSKRPVPLRS
jgi:hypothetical protein